MSRKKLGRMEVLLTPIRTMHKVYGSDSGGRRCKTCEHLVIKMCSQSFAVTDWRAGWPACGKYEDKGGIPAYPATVDERTRHEK